MVSDWCGRLRTSKYLGVTVVSIHYFYEIDWSVSFLPPIMFSYSDNIYPGFKMVQERSGLIAPFQRKLILHTIDAAVLKVLTRMPTVAAEIIHAIDAKEPDYTIKNRLTAMAQRRLVRRIKRGGKAIYEKTAENFGVS